MQEALKPYQEHDQSQCIVYLGDLQQLYMIDEHKHHKKIDVKYVLHACRCCIQLCQGQWLYQTDTGFIPILGKYSKIFDNVTTMCISNTPEV